MKDTDYMSIGELAKRMNTTVRTLQYYDREGLLNPSCKSESGRRKYTEKDMVKLHQILSLKYLGFSLAEIKDKLYNMDTPEQVQQILNNQKYIIRDEIKKLENAYEAIDCLEREVKLMSEVDFNKYADIISLLKVNDKNYWFIKFFDNTLMEHIKDRFMHNENGGNDIFERWRLLCIDCIELKNKNVAPESHEGQSLAKKWWDLVIEFTGGDMSLLPKLMDFNNTKEEWTDDMKNLQSQSEEFIQRALGYYLQNQSKSVHTIESGCVNDK